MKKFFRLIALVVALVIVATSFITYSPASSQGNSGHIGSAFGVANVGGQPVDVHVIYFVPAGQNENAIAAQALADQGARPVAQRFSTTGLVWDQFFDSNPGNNFVLQNLNPANDPLGGGGLTALLNTHNTWNAVGGSSFAFSYGGTTSRCPSLVKECKGRQTYDGYNDVAFMPIRDRNTLGVTWSSSSNDEADMAINTNFTWSTDGTPGTYDLETVILHENGHVAGLGHSEYTEAVMYAYASDGFIHRTLHFDDIDGIQALYP